MQTLEFFNPGQLSLIRSVALVCADELSVYDTLAEFTRGWEPEQLEVIRFCAQECAHQKSGALSVFDMVNAWNYAMDRKHEGADLTDELLIELAEMIEPDLPRGWRTGTVTKQGGIVIGSKPEHIAGDMTELVAMLAAHNQGERQDNYGRPMTAQALYERFEGIHPRDDGNGRLGKVIFNWLGDCLDCPQFPTEPEHFRA